MRKITLVLFLLVSTLAWATPGQDWLSLRVGERTNRVEAFTVAYSMGLRRSIPDSEYTTFTLAIPMYDVLDAAMVRYYQKTKDLAKDPGYLQEQLIWDYLLHSPKAGPILKKLIDAGTVRPPEPLPPVPN